MKPMHADMLGTSLLVLIGRGVGFLVPFIIAAQFGTSWKTDAFFLSYGIILYMQMVLGNVFETAIVPYVTDQRAKGENPAAFFGGVLGRTTVFLTGIVLLLIFLAGPLMRRLAGFDPHAARLGAELLNEMLLTIFLIAWTSILSGALNAVKSFHVAALSPGVRSLVVIAVIFCLKDWFGIHVLAVGYLIGEFIRFLFSAYFCHQRIGPIRPGWKLSPESRKFFRSVFLQTAAFSILSSLAFINQIMAARLGEGSLTLLTYGERMRNVPFLLFFSGILSVVFSHWAHDFSQKGAGYTWDHSKKTILWLTLGAGLFSALVIYFKEPLTAIAFARGAFPQHQLDDVAQVFGLLMIGFPFDVLALLSVRLFILHKKEGVYLVCAAGRIAGTIFLNLILMKTMGVVGIALSASVVNVIYGLTLFGILRGMVSVRKD